MTNLSLSFRCFGVVALLATMSLGCASVRGSKSDSFVGKKSESKKSGDVSSSTKLAWAQVQMREGQHSEARKTYQGILEKDPKCVGATLGLAQLDLLANRTQEAEKSFQKALKQAPDSPQVLDAVGQYYASTERYAEAISLFKKSIEIDPDQKKYRYHLAVAMAKSGRVNESMNYFVHAVGPAGAHYNVGRILYDQGKMEASEEQFIQALMKDPNLREAQEWLDEVRQQKDAQLTRGRGQQNSGGTVRANASSTPKSRTNVQPTANQTATTNDAANPFESESNTIRTTDRIAIPQGAMNPPAAPNRPIPAEQGMANSPSNLSPIQQEQMRNQQLRAQQQSQQRQQPARPQAPAQNVWESLP